MMRINLGLQQKTVFDCKALLRPFLVCFLLFVVPGTSDSLVLQRRSPVQSTPNDWKTLLADADQLRSQWTAASWRQARQKYQTALLELRRSGSHREEARVLRSLGLVELALGDTTAALQTLTSSLNLLKELKIADTELVDTLNDAASAQLQIGNNKQARTVCNESLELSRSLSYAKGEGLTLELMGQVEYASGNLTKSLDLFQTALPILKRAGDERGQAQTFLDFGYSFSDLSETDKAKTSYEQALTLWRKITDPRSEALTLTALGHLYSKLGNKQQALNLYYQSIELLQPIEDRIALAYNFDGLGFIHAGLGDTSAALQDYTKTLQLFREAKFRYGEVAALWRVGQIHIANEDYQTALDYLNNSLMLSRSLGDPRMQAIPAGLIGQIHERQNQFALAIEDYKRALMFNREGKDEREEAYTLSNIGRVQQAQGSNQEALDNYTRALALNRATGDRFGESGTLYRIAAVEQALGRSKDARSHCEQSISLIESLRGGVASPDLRSSYVATVHQVYELYIDVLMSLHKLDPSAGFDRTALEASEAGRARTLLEILAETKTQIGEGVDPKLLERERALQLQLESLATRQVKSSGTGVSQKEVLELDNELERATTEYHDVQGQIRALSPHYAALVQPVTLKVDQIQQMLEPETLLLETSLGEKRSFLWAVTRDSVKSYKLPSQAEIEKLVRRLYSEITASSEPSQRIRTESNGSYDSDARQISSMLFGRLDNRTEIKRLVIVADGVLQYVPFASLPSPFSEKDNLVLRYEIVRLPSASVLAIQRAQFAGRAPASKSVAVLADPVFDKMDPRVIALTSARNGRMRNWRSSPAVANEKLLAKSFSTSRALRDSGLVVNGRIPRLLFSAAEADAVYAASSGTDSLKAIGFKANRSILTGSELSQYKVIHIASHGVLNSKHPELSGIVLSMVDENGKPIDGFLQLHEIYNLRLPAELVVLSACETAIGKEIRGEGLIALTRGFMYAGAARVVATLWKVDDAATATLMAQFYKEMFTNGKTPAAALQAAQIYVSQQKRWQEPYYWAGFMLQGEWR